jgi:hypothetical protein
MECAQCGTPNDENAAFCKRCGSPLTSGETPEAYDAPAYRAAAEGRPVRTWVQGAYFFVAMLSSIAGMLSYFFPWVEVTTGGAVAGYHEYLWYWPLVFADSSFLAALLFFGFNFLPILLAFSFAIMASLQIKSGELGKGFFYASLFMAVIFAFFLAGCLDFAEYVTKPFERQWLRSLGSGHGDVTVTVRVGPGFLLLLPAEIGYLISTALSGFSLWRRRVITLQTASVNFFLSFVACLAGYILLWSLLSIML